MCDVVVTESLELTY